MVKYVRINKGKFTSSYVSFKAIANLVQYTLEENQYISSKDLVVFNSKPLVRTTKDNINIFIHLKDIVKENTDEKILNIKNDILSILNDFTEYQDFKVNVILN